MPNIANKHETYMELKKTNRKWEKNELFFGKNIRNANFTPNS